LRGLEFRYTTVRDTGIAESGEKVRRAAQATRQGRRQGVHAIASRTEQQAWKASRSAEKVEIATACTMLQ